MADIKCSICGNQLGGPALYCYGCYQYMCRSCGVASGYNEWSCPHCAIEADKISV